MPTPHERLLEEYADSLRTAKDVAEEWWEALLASETSSTMDREEAVRNVQQRWPYGPAAHPRVLAVVRKYYFACEALNDRLAETRNPEEEYPQVFVTDMLMEDGTDDLGAFVYRLPGLPIGIDSDGDPV
jgi:hypothetical protein